VPVYVLAFYTGNLPFRAVSGTALLIVIGWLLVWLWRQFLARERSLPRLAVTRGLTSFGYGAILGVALQIVFAMGGTLPGNGVGAHAAAMTFGYLVLVAFGVIEWRILGTTGLPRSGLVQVLAIFIGGLIISISLLAGAEQAGGAIYLLAQLIAVVLFVVRIWPTSLRVAWLQTTPLRHIAAASIWVVGALIMFMYVVFTFISDPAAGLLENVLVASDHAVYLGVVTNGAIGFMTLMYLSREERTGWIGHSSSGAFNVFLLIFVVGLVARSPEIKRIGAPVMGVVLLFALGLLAYRAATASDAKLAGSAAALTPS